MKRRFSFVLGSLALLLVTQQPVTADPSRYPQFAQQSPPANVSLISVDELVQQITAGKKPMIIDVRSEEEYREVHILGALSAPLPEFNAYAQSVPKDRLVILY
jgi:rhodanese-related sulfurtransferase